MKNSRDNKPVGRLVRTIVLLPVVSLIWMIGWTLYYVGDQRVNQSAKTKPRTFSKQVLLKEKT